MSNKEQIEQINDIGRRAQGRSQLLKYLEGKSVTRGEAIKGFCYQCLGFCVDGVEDCGTPECILYPFSPYHNLKEGDS